MPTLSNAFDISRKIPLTYSKGFASNDLSMSRVIDKSW